MRMEDRVQQQHADGGGDERGQVQPAGHALLDAVAEREQEVEVAQQVAVAGVRERGSEGRQQSAVFGTVGEAGVPEIGSG